MSVRMAIVKLAALGAAGALIGGGAVHMAEQAKEGPVQYVKHARAAIHSWRHVTTTTTRECPPAPEQSAALVPQTPPDEAQADNAPPPPPLPGPYYWTCTGFAPVTYLIKPPWLRTRAG